MKWGNLKPMIRVTKGSYESEENESEGFQSVIESDSDYEEV